MLSLENKNKKIKWLFIIVAIFLILGIIIVATCYLFEIKYKNKIYPGISIGEVDLSGLSKEQAIFLLNKKVDYINNNGINLFFDSYNAIIFPLVTSLETDLAYEIINFDTEETVNKIMNIGNPEGKTSIKELAEKIVEITGNVTKIEYVAFGDSDRSEKREIFNRIPDITKAKETIGYEPKYSLEDGLKEIYNHYHSNPEWVRADPDWDDYDRI